MPSFKNRIGEKYGRLTVTGYAGKDNRKFIGIEKEKKYYDVTLKRINEYLNNNK